MPQPMDRIVKTHQLATSVAVDKPWSTLDPLPTEYQWKQNGESYKDIPDNTPMTYELLVKKLKDLEYRIRALESE